MYAVKQTPACVQKQIWRRGKVDYPRRDLTSDQRGSGKVVGVVLVTKRKNWLEVVTVHGPSSTLPLTLLEGVDSMDDSTYPT